MNDNPTDIPPLPLKITATALIALFIILPIVVLIGLGDLASVPIVVLGGLSFVGLTLGAMFLHRIILWVHYRFYWYLMAAGYVLLAVCASIFIVPLITPMQIATINTLPVWGKSLLVPGAIVGIVALVLAFRHHPVTTPIPVAVAPASPPPTPQKHAIDTAQQIAARKKDLGIDNTKGVP